MPLPWYLVRTSCALSFLLLTYSQRGLSGRNMQKMQIMPENRAWSQVMRRHENAGLTSREPRAAPEARILPENQRVL